MSLSKPEKTREAGRKRKDIVAEITDTFEWLITAFILALLIRTFLIEPFRIPTGSMADTLMGAHFRLRCQQCGYEYRYGLGNYRLPRDTIPRGSIRTMASRCPSCGHYQRTGGAMPIANGDRILVLKCIYQFFEPKQWDVIVFKNPLDPKENYIKRLVGRPEETVEIIDGDVYINGQISRKPPKVQNKLWMPIYDNDYQPIRPSAGSFNGHKWQQPFRNIEGSKWELGKDNRIIFCLDSDADEINTLIYDTSIGNDFRATYAYDDVREYNYMPYCSDLMVRFYARLTALHGHIGAALSKYQNEYKAWVDLAGEMVIAQVAQGEEFVELARKPIAGSALNKSALFKFSNVDHELIFEFGEEKLTYDLGRGRDDAGVREMWIGPEVKIFGSGNLTLSHIAIFRDIHYTEKKSANSTEQGRAVNGKAFVLGRDEFFVLGDNSPNSEDCRWWSRKGVGNNGRMYREGIVPREYLMGKALFVYWPSGFKPHPKFPFGIIPSVGQVRFIYGGSGR